jgi:hypothetical protein
MTDFDWSKVTVRELELLPKRSSEPFAILPLAWAVKAAIATHTPKALVWVWLIHQARKTKSNTVAMSNEALAQYGISRYAKMRALRQLEAAGLVEIGCRRGQAITVRLLA